MNTSAVTTPTLNFDNRFARELPADAVTTSQRRQVMDACYSRVTPTPVSAPTLVAFAPDTSIQTVSVHWRLRALQSGDR